MSLIPIGTWLSIDLMGHQRIVGMVAGTDGPLVLIDVPALDGDDRHEPSEHQQHLVNLAGPALYHARVITSTAALSELAMARRWKSSEPPQIALDDDDDGDEETPF